MHPFVACLSLVRFFFMLFTNLLPISWNFIVEPGTPYKSHYFLTPHTFFIYCFLVCILSLCLIQSLSEHILSPLTQPTPHLFLFFFNMDCVFFVIGKTSLNSKSQAVLHFLTDVL